MKNDVYLLGFLLLLALIVFGCAAQEPTKEKVPEPILEESVPVLPAEEPEKAPQESVVVPEPEPLPEKPERAASETNNML